MENGYTLNGYCLETQHSSILTTTVLKPTKAAHPLCRRRTSMSRM